jgi:hypothetical protein
VSHKATCMLKYYSCSSAVDYIPPPPQRMGAREASLRQNHQFGGVMVTNLQYGGRSSASSTTRPLVSVSWLHLQHKFRLEKSSNFQLQFTTLACIMFAHPHAYSSLHTCLACLNMLTLCFLVYSTTPCVNCLSYVTWNAKLIINGDLGRTW